LWQSVRVEAAAFVGTSAAFAVEIRESAAGYNGVVDKIAGRRSCLLLLKISGIWLLTLVVALHTTWIEAAGRIAGLLIPLTHLNLSLLVTWLEYIVSELRSRVRLLNLLLWNEFLEGFIVRDPKLLLTRNKLTG
jgi:hypothetical protein